MQLTLQTDYALRTLLYLLVSNDEWPSAGSIAEAYGISKAHLVKVIQQLAAEGFVETRPGRTGGVRLAMHPEDIRIGDVVRKLEPNLALVGCFADKKACVISSACCLASAFDEALSQFLAVLDSYTLASCGRDRRRLAPLLQIGVPKRAASGT